jgi:hypothetical protein
MWEERKRHDGWYGDGLGQFVSIRKVVPPCCWSVATGTVGSCGGETGACVMSIGSSTRMLIARKAFRSRRPSSSSRGYVGRPGEEDILPSSNKLVHRPIQTLRTIILRLGTISSCVKNQHCADTSGQRFHAVHQPFYLGD